MEDDGQFSARSLMDKIRFDIHIDSPGQEGMQGIHGALHLTRGGRIRQSNTTTGPHAADRECTGAGAQHLPRRG